MLKKCAQDNVICKETKFLSKRILNKHAPVFSPAIVHGKKFEKKACSLAFRHLSLSHQNLVSSNCGSFVCEKFPFLSSSPDRVLKCTCCGKSILEVKNPYTGRHLSIADYAKTPTSCLQVVGDCLKLKPCHPYYYQLQVEMYVTRATTGVFCVKTNHKRGVFIETVKFDDVLMTDLIAKAEIFFDKAIVNELYHEKILNQVVAKLLAQDMIILLLDKAITFSEHSKHDSLLFDKPSVSNCSVFDTPALIDFDTANNISVTTSYRCPICNLDCVDIPMAFDELSIECSKCESWFHLHCVGLNGSEPCVQKKKRKLVQRMKRLRQKVNR